LIPDHFPAVMVGRRKFARLFLPGRQQLDVRAAGVDHEHFESFPRRALFIAVAPRSHEVWFFRVHRQGILAGFCTPPALSVRRWRDNSPFRRGEPARAHDAPVGKFSLRERSGAQIVKLPYKGGMSMRVVLPPKQTPFQVLRGVD